ncbi:hypothetical protein ACFO6V_01160 [Promicromonospora alba]|uniref:HEAT repeat protein n=1 Tax=Promicromonospora alba TaxID=1616110 RepID=A0ABV9HCM2_9MICO
MTADEKPAGGTPQNDADRPRRRAGGDEPADQDGRTDENDREADPDGEPETDSSLNLADLDRDLTRFLGPDSIRFDAPVDIRGATTIGGSQHIHLGGEQRRRTLSTPIAVEYLVEMRQLDADHPSAGAARAALQTNKLCILQGPRGSGRGFIARTAAADLVGEGGHCRLIEPGTDPRDLAAEDFEADCSYVLESPEIARDRSLAEYVLARLASLLTRRKAALVLVVDDDVLATDEVTTWVVRITDSLSRAAVLRSHLRHHSAREGRTEGLELLDDPLITTWLDQDAPSLTEVARIGARLAKGDPPAECVEGAGARQRETVREILGSPEKPRELAIAIAFFGGLPYSTVYRMETGLAELVHAVTGDDGPRRSRFLRERRSRLDEIGAEITQRTVTTEYGASPAEVVEFRRPQMFDAVIEQTWRDFGGSEILLTWLGGLAVHRDVAVRLRAATSVGRLSWLGFGDVAENLLQSWSYSTSSRRRLAAAMALSVAMQNEAVAGHALGLVESWTTAGSRQQRTTAALSWGLAVSPLWPYPALDGLGRLLSDRDGGVVARAVRDGLSNVFEGHPELVVRTLDQWWSTADASYRREILAAFLQSCPLSGVGRRASALPAVLEMLETGLTRPAPRPADGSDGGSAREAVLRLWRAALRAPESQPVALPLLLDWVRQADRETPYRDPVLELIVHVVVDERDRLRLRHALKGLLSKPRDPSPTASSPTAQVALERLDERAPTRARP